MLLIASYLAVWAVLLILVAVKEADFFVAYYDFWVGVFIDRKRGRVYIALFPCLVFSMPKVKL